MAAGSGGYGGPNFAQISSDLQNVALQFGAIVTLQRQLGATLDSWRELQRQLTLSNAAAQGTATQFKEMETAARNFALATNFSAQQVANAFYNLASAGLTVRQTLAAASGVLLLSQATLTDLGEASDITASALAQFNLKASDSTRIANLFVASTNSSLATVNKLAFALKQVGPVAQQANLSLEDTVAILDKMFDAGLRGEQAGTALRNVLVRLQDPQGRARQLLNTVGVTSINKDTGAAVSALDQLRQLANKDLSQSSLAIVSGTEGLAGFLTTLKSLKTEVGQTTTEFDRHKDAITGTNAAYRQAVQQANTLDGSLRRAGNAFAELRLIVGEQLAPVVAKLATDFETLVDNIRNVDAATVTTTGNVALLAIGVGFAVKAYLSWVPALGKVATAIIAVREAQTALTAAQALADGAARTAAIGEATTALRTQRLAALGAAAGWVAVAAAVVAAAVALVKWNEAREAKRVADIAEGVIGAQAEKRGARPDEVARLRDNTDYTVNTAGDLRRIPQISPIGSDGTGAVDRSKRFLDFIAAQQQIAEDIQTRSKDLTQNYEKSRAAIATSIDALTKLTNQAPEKLALLGASADDGNRIARTIINKGVALGGVADADAKEAVINYYDSIIQAVAQSESLSASKRKETIDKLRVIQNKIATGDRLIAEKYKEGLSTRLAEAEKTLGSGSLGNARAGNTIGAALRDAIAFTEEKTVLSAAQIADIVAENNRRASVAIGAISIANNKLAQNDDNVIKEAKLRLFEGSNLPQSKVEELTSYLNKLPKAKNDELVKIIAAQRAGGKTDLDLAPVFKALSDELIKKGVVTREQLTEAVAKGYSVAFVDELKLKKLIETNRTKSVEQAIRIATLRGESTKALNTELIASLKAQATEEVAQELVKAVSEGDLQVQNSLEGLLASAEGNKIRDILLNYASATEKQQAEFRETFKQILLKSNKITAGTQIGNILTAYSGQLQNELSDAGIKQEEDTNRRAELLKKLINLPNEQQNAATAQKLALAVQFTVSDYFNVPILGLQKAFEQSALDNNAKFSELTKKFQAVYGNTLADQVSALLNDGALQDAFSGQSIRDLVETGKGTFEGKTYKDLSELVNAIGNRFAEVGAKADLAPERIEAARKQLGAMAEQITLFYQQTQQDFRLLYIRNEEAKQAASRFLTTFNLEDIIAQFNNTVRAGASDPAKTTLTIDLAINARVAKIKIDAEDAINKIRASYVELLKQKGIAAFIDAEGKLQLADSVPVPNRAVTTEARDLGNTTPRDIGVAINDNMRKAFDYFLSKGLSKQQAAGVVGSLAGESGLNPDAVNPSSGAYGIAQWRGSRKKELEEYLKGKSDKFAGQLEFVWKEYLSTEKKAYNALIQQSTVGGAERVHTLGFERPSAADAASSKARRQNVGYALAGDQPGPITLSQPAAPQVNPAVQTAFEAVKARLEELEAAERKYVADLQEFFAQNGANELIAMQDALDKRAEIYAQFQGKIDQANAAAAQRQLAAASAIQAAATSQYFNPRVNDQQALAINKSAIVAKINAQLEVDKTNKIIEQRRIYDELINKLATSANDQKLSAEQKLTIEGQIAQLVVDRAAAEAGITLEYEKRKELTPSSADAARQTAGSLQEALSSKYNQAGLNGGNQSIFAGLKNGAIDAAKSIQSGFELSTNIARMGIEGLADAGAALLSGNAANAKQMVASLLQSMAQLIFKMLAMYAVIQLISAIPGGAAVLAALDIGANASRVVSAGAAVANAGATIISSGSGANNAAANFKGYAEGGVHGPNFGRATMQSGGIRSPYSPARALFGEGQYPEAFIPLLDGRTVSIMIDADGQPYIPLPSGQHIKGSIKGQSVRKFASGGTSDPRLTDSLIRPSRAYASGSAGASDNVIKGGDTYQISIPITITGRADEDTANLTGQEVAKQVTALLNARDAENKRKEMRNKGTLQG